MLIGPITARRSDAKNAYDLMSDIREYILEEPKRLWMGDWIMGDMDEVEMQFGVEGPACGTVGCIAGNAAVLTNRLRPDVQSTALDLLGGTDEVLRGRLYSLFLWTHVGADYGTEEYARIVAERIEDFQVSHEGALRAVTVEVRP